MKLNQYIEKHIKAKGLTVQQFATSAGLSTQAIYNLMNGMKPNMGTAEKIKVATNGKVTPNDWSEK